MISEFIWLGLIYVSDRMAEIIKKEVDVKESEIISTVEEICFVNIPEDEIKQENTEIQGKLNNSSSCKFKFNILKVQMNYGIES